MERNTDTSPCLPFLILSLSLSRLDRRESHSFQNVVFGPAEVMAVGIGRAVVQRLLLEQSSSANGLIDCSALVSVQNSLSVAHVARLG